VNGIEVEVTADGKITAHSGDKTQEVSLIPKAGDTMPDGTVCAGVSEDGKELMFTPPENSGVGFWDDAMELAANADENGHSDWRLMTRSEMEVVYFNRYDGALKGTFNENGPECQKDFGSDGRYWTSNGSSDYGRLLRVFGTGEWVRVREGRSNVRLIRTEPIPSPI